MIIRNEKAELLQIINTTPAVNIEGFGYGVPVNEVHLAFNGPKEIADMFLCQLEQEGKVEIFRKPELDDMILAARAT